MRSTKRTSGYAALPAIAGIAMMLTLSLTMLFKQALVTRDQAAKTQLKLDYSQREEALMRALVAVFPSRAIACMKADHAAGENWSWSEIFADAVALSGADLRLTEDMVKDLRLETARQADVGDGSGAEVRSWITSLTGTAGRVTPGTTAYADVFSQSAFTGRVPPLLEMSQSLQEADALRPVVTPAKRYAAQSAGLLADVTAHPVYNLIPYPNIRFGYAQPGQPFVAKRNWWAFSVNYGGARQPVVRHYVLSLYEVPSQMPIEAATFAAIGQHEDGAFWSMERVRIEGSVYADAMAVESAHGASRLAGRSGIEMSGPLDLGGVEVDSNFDALGVREQLQAERQSDALPVALSANSGRLAFLPLQPGNSFLLRPSAGAPSAWDDYLAGAGRCRVTVEALEMISLADQTPVKLRVRFQNTAGGVSEAVLQRGVNWPTIFDEGGEAMPFQTELTDNGRSCLTFKPALFDAWLLAGNGAGIATNNSLWFGVDTDAAPESIKPPDDPPAPDDMCVIIRQGKDLTAWTSGISVVTPHRVYIGDDLNAVPAAQPPAGSGLADTDEFFPPLSIFSAELRIGTTVVNRLVEHHGQLGTLSKTGPSAWKPLDIKLGSDDAVHSDHISADLKPLRSPAELPPVHQMNWLVVIEEITQD
ncbi:MAG TPA: hypothetical protein DIT13_00015 [Verrucomicrobiales bacterium]|nr:hypothetical protein [Verrucomicrobiales bacterium]HRJ09147.1 hypothetical protein [Prosthecobacter sp.]HRK15633.1 hypothetical protein [Prosthecobacter sp.]